MNKAYYELNPCPIVCFPTKNIYNMDRFKTSRFKLKPNQNNYTLYYNELLLMNNNVLVNTPHQQSLFVPFTILSYYQTSDKITCEQAEEFLNKQLQSSKLLNTAGEKEKLTFFNKIHSKIDALYQLIEAAQKRGYI